MNVDKQLLRQQIKFMYSYKWAGKKIPDEVVGITNLLEALEEANA
jgi:hypothetical protein